MQFDDKTIWRFLNGELSEEETKEFDLQMVSSPELRQAVRQMLYINHLTENLVRQRSIDPTASWHRLSRRISMSRLKYWTWHYTRTAAAILLPLFLLHQYLIQPLLSGHKDEMITLTSAPGVVIKTILPDGSEVWLNAQSELSYPIRFESRERVVRLKGEAFFQVKADKRHPFSVMTPEGVSIRALGTAFNVNAYEGETNYQITLARGVVEVASPLGARRERLVPDNKLVVSTQTGEMRAFQADTYVETAWKEGKMVFRREKLETIARKLSRKFGVIMQLEGDQLMEYEYTATFTDETLEEILELLTMSAPITYTIAKQEKTDDNTFTSRIIIVKGR